MNAGEKKSRKILMAACATVLATSAAASAADVTWSGANANNSLWSTATNWVGNAAPVPQDSLVFEGFAQLTPNNDYAAGTAFNGITFGATAGAFSLVGNQIALGGNINDNTAMLNETVSLALLLTGNRNVGVTDTGLLTLGGVVSGNFGITKTGAGTLFLTAANTFTGTLGINAGVVSVSADNNLGATTAGANRLVIDGGALRSTANMTIASARGIALGNAGGGGGTFMVQSGTTLTYGGVIANNGGAGSLTKLNFGQLTLSGANTYTGATNVRNGTLQLNFADAAAPLTNIISPSSTLVLGGATAGLGQNNNATLSMSGKAASANVQTFNNTNIDIYGSVINVTNGAGGTATLNLGALTHTVGGTVVIPTNATNGTVRTSTTVATTNGILGGWAVAGTTDVQRGITQGSAFATVDGTGKIVPYTAHVAVPIYTPGDNTTLIRSNPGIVADADKNIRFTGSATSSIMRVDVEFANTTTDINTFSYLPNGANHTLIIGSGNTLRLGKYGGIYKPVNGNNQVYIGGSLDQALSGNGVYGAAGLTPIQVGSLTAGGPTLGTPGEIVLTTNETANNNGTLNILASIVDNGPGGAVTLVKTSVSSVKIDGHNRYSGGTFINQGRFQLAGSEVERSVDPNDPTPLTPSLPLLTYGNPDGLGSGPVIVAPGGYLFVSGVNGTGLFTGPGAIAGARANSAQNAPIPNALTISGVGTSQEGIGAIRLGGKAILSGQLTLGGDARIGGSSNNGNPNVAFDTYPALNADNTTLYVDPSHELSGKITGPFNLDIGSNNSISTNFKISNSANDWTGDTTFVTGGGTTILRLGNDEVIPNGPGKGNLVWGPLVTANIGRLDLQGHNETVNGLSTTTANLASVFIENTGFNATVVPTPTEARPDLKGYAFTVGTSTLTVGDFDATATFGGTIRDNETTRPVTLPNSNYALVDTDNDPLTPPIDPEGDLPTLQFTAPWVDVGGGVGSKVALTKIGTGVQTLTGQNTYTGDTSINNGTLVVTGQLAQNGKVKINSSASAAGTLSGTGNVGDVTMAANVAGHKATISPGASAAIGSIGLLSLNSLTVNGGDIAIDVGQSTSDVISVATTAVFNAAATISPGPSGTAGTYTILQANGGITYNVAPTLVMPALTRSTFALDTISNPNALQLIVTGGSKSLTWTGTVNGRWDIVGIQNWLNDDNPPTPDRFFNGDSVTFGDVNTNRNLLLDATVLPASVNFTNSSGNDYTLGGVGAISGSANLSKNGTGKLTILTNNTYTGQTQISQGTVQVGNGGTSGALGSGGVVSEGTLIFNRSDNIIFNQTMDGGGNLVKQGAGVLRLGGINTYGGTTSIEQGSIVVTNSSSLGNVGGAGVTVNSGAALDLSGDNTANDLNFQTKLFTIAGTGVNGTGALTHSGTVGQQNAFQQVALSADATVGGTGRFDIRAPAGAVLDLAGHTLTKVGTNQFTLVNVDVFDGNIVVNEGTFAIEAATSIPDNGTGTTITYNAGTTAQFFGNAPGGGGAGSVVLRPMVLNGGVTMGNANNNAGATIGSNMTLGGNLNIAVLNNANATSLTLLGNIGEIGGARSVTKTGATTLTLSGSSTYSGGTTISAGILVVNNTAGSATGTGPVSLGDNVTLTGNGTIAGTVSVSGTAHVAPADGLAILTLGGLALSEGSTLDFEGAETNFDKIILTGTNTLTFSGNALMNLTEAGPLSEGTFTLIDYNGAPIGNLTGKLTLSSPVFSGLNASLIDDPVTTAIKLKLENPNGAPQWAVDAGGSWTTGSNWSNGIAPDGANATARFLGIITAPRTITLDGDRTIGTLIFENANKYTIAAGTGGTLTIGDAANSGGITVTTGNHEISAAVAVAGTPVVDVAANQSLNLSGGVAIAAGKSLTKSGQGTLRVGGAANHAGGASLVAQQGTVQLDSNQGTPVAANLAVSIVGNPGGTASTVVVNADQDLNSLTVTTADPGTQTLDLKSPAGAGLFHAVHVYAADLNAAKSSLSAAIRNANAAGAADPLDGIVDSGLHAASGIGIAITGDHVTIRPTRVGDLNLDGQVTISDFIDLASNFNAINKSWQEGDLNNDGIVSISDFIDLASNFNANYAGSPAAISADERLTLASFASSVGVDPSVIGSAVPEPASLGLLAVGAIGLLSRRRRKA